jgi:hypothetical protein
MKRFLHLAARLYPSWWRRRYAAEFAALIDDVNPGWRELLDLMNGALAMQIRTLRMIPVFCILAGIAVGGLIAMGMPARYSTSATILLKGPDVPNAESIRAAIQKRLAELQLTGAERSSTISFRRATGGSDPTQTIVKLTYMDRNPAQAQHVVEKLAGAFAGPVGGGEISSEILEAPILTTTPVRPDYAKPVAFGGIVGLAAGGLMAMFLRLQGRPAKDN